MNRILLVDDEPKMREMIIDYSVLEDFTIEEAVDGLDGLQKFKEIHYDVILLDVMMPKIDGWALCREIRKSSDVPILMISARGEEYDRLLGFELGVDDYIVKPFSPKELMARIRVMLKRSKGTTVSDKEDSFEKEDFSLNYNSHSVKLGDKVISLTPKEYELLSHFCKNPNQVFSRDQLLNSVWGFDFFGDHRTVDTHVKMLRESLQHRRNWIVTVWGTGYKFVPGGNE